MNFDEFPQLVRPAPPAEKKKKQPVKTSAPKASVLVSASTSHLPLAVTKNRVEKNIVKDILPVDAAEQEICVKAMDSDVLIVAGDTGCGKSTRTPTFLAKTLHHSDGKKIFITQPRRVAAISLAKRVATEVGDVDSDGNALFSRVGYAVGQDRRFDDNSAEFVFCTCGWLLLKLLNDMQFIDSVSYLVVDEAHERDSDMDLLLFVCKLLLQRCAGRIKLVLMSATLNYRAFEHYFPGKVNIVNINMRRFPVEIAHLNTLRKAILFFKTDPEVANFLQTIDDAKMKKDKDDPNGYFAALCALCEKIWVKILPGSATTILVFLSGIQEIDTAYDFLAEVMDSSVQICVLHSMVEQETQMSVFSPLPKKADCKHLRIVLSTNIAESSVTIPEVSVVVDFGKQKVMRRTANSNIMELAPIDISRAAADQRAGRTGRVCNGTVIRFYSDFDYKFFAEHNRSEIQDAPPATTILRFFTLKKSNSANIQELADPLKCIAQLVDPPNEYDVLTAFNELIQLGALTDECSETSSITSFGTMLVRLPLSFSHSQFALFGCQFHVYSAHFAVMAAFLNNSDIWLNPNHKDADPMRYQNWLRLTTESRQNFGLRHNSDLLAAVEIFREMLQLNRRRGQKEYSNWINRNGFHFTRVEKFMTMACDILSHLSECGFAGCQQACAAIYNRRFKNGALSLAQVDSFLPISQRDSKACSLIIGWAFIKNLVNSTMPMQPRLRAEAVEKKKQAFVAKFDNQPLQSENDDGDSDEDNRLFLYCDPSEDRASMLKKLDEHIASLWISDREEHESICLLVQMEVVGDVKQQQPDSVLQKVLSEYFSIESLKSNLPKFEPKNGKWFSSGLVRFYPQKIRIASHFMQQLLNRNVGALQYNVKGLKCQVLILNITKPRTIEWLKTETRRKVYDFPPRSLLHDYPVDQTLSNSTTKKCFLPGRANLIAVASEFTLTGKSLRAPLLSLISADCRLCFAVVARFHDPKYRVEIIRDRVSNDDGKKFHLYNREFSCGVLTTEKDYATAEQIIGPLSDPLVEMLRQWTLQDITSKDRSSRIVSHLTALLSAITE